MLRPQHHLPIGTFGSSRARMGSLRTLHPACEESTNLPSLAMTLGKAAAVHLGLIVWCGPKWWSDMARSDDDGAGLERAAALLALRQPQRRHGGERNQAAVSRPTMAFLTRTDPTRNIDRFRCRQRYPDAVRRTGGVAARMGPARLTRYPAPRKPQAARGGASRRAAHDQAPAGAGLHNRLTNSEYVSGSGFNAVAAS